MNELTMLIKCHTTQKKKFFARDFFSKYDQIRSFLMENFTFLFLLSVIIGCDNPLFANAALSLCYLFYYVVFYFNSYYYVIRIWVFSSKIKLKYRIIQYHL